MKLSAEHLLPLPDEVDPANVITAARATLDPDVKLTINGLAESTGMTADQVRSVLATPAFTQEIEGNFKLMLMGSLMRGMLTMDRIINDSRAKVADKVNAFRGLCSTYQALASTLPKNESAAAREDLKRVLRALENTSPIAKRTA